MCKETEREAATMCGFCGFAGELLQEKADVLNRMMNKIVHRGPDSAGTHIDKDVALGFRRLSIMDLDYGSQPMYNETGDVVITFNGEIYNYGELREDLEAKGHVFANHADTECLIHAYEEYGKEEIALWGQRLLWHQAFLLYPGGQYLGLWVRNQKYFGIPRCEKRSERSSLRKLSILPVFGVTGNLLFRDF